MAGVKGGQAPKHRWTEEEEEIVRREYKGTNASARWIADYLSHLTGERITIWAVKGKAAALGILKQKSPPWTPDELERLQLLIHKHPIPQIAKRLGRSCNAVKVKATRLKLGLRTRDDWYTKRDVCEILGVDHHKVQAWIDRGALVATWHSDRKPQRNGMAMWHITTEALRSFIIRHCGELMGRNVDIQQIVWIIAGDMKVYRELKGEKE